MNKFFIKPFSFVDYVDRDWGYWKFGKLTEARLRLLEKYEDDLQRDDDESSSYAYAGNITKIPILWDADDYKFLSQFPPKLWTRALMWRYNTGLLQASQLRDDDPQHDIAVVPNYGDVVLEYTPKKQEKAKAKKQEKEDADEESEGGEVLDDVDNPEDFGKKFVFHNAYTGFRNLLEKLEKPIKYRQEHNPPGSEKDAPGLEDIDPFETDPAHPRHHSKYTHGLYDYDITNPVEVSDEYINNIPAEDIELPAKTPRTPENIEAARERMKENRQHSFAGMSVLQYPTAAKSLHSWIKAQGLGLLGDVPKNVEDPLEPGKEVTTERQDPSKKPPVGRSHVGEVDVHGQRIPLNLQLIKRKLNYEVVNRDGTTTQKSDIVSMPYLNPVAALPRITNLSPEQRQKFAERRGFSVENSCPGTAGLSWDAIEAKCTAAKRAGAPGDIYNLLLNYDILTPEQKEHLVKNQRNLLHIAHSSETETANKKTKDFWSRPGQFYSIGFTPNKSRQKIRPSDLTPEQLGKAIDKYWDKLLWEADDAVGVYIKNEYKKKEMPKSVIDMLDRIKTDLALVCAALLARNLNSPGLGIRDEELGLIGVKKSEKPERISTNRKDYTYKFVKSLSQAAFGDIGSRRAREKGLTGGGVSLDQPAGEEGGTLKDVTPGESGEGRGPGISWFSRRTYNRPLTAPKDREEAEAAGTTMYPVARVNWNIPNIGHKIDKFFQSTRNLISARVGEKYAVLADKARDKFKIELEVMQQLLDTEAKELEAKGLSGEELERQANANALEKLPAALNKARPDLYKDIGEKEKQALIQRHKQTTRAKLDPEMQAAEDEYMDEFFKNILAGKEWPFPTYDPEIEDFGEGPVMSLDKLKDGQGQPLDANGVVTFIRSVWTEDGAKKYAMPLLMAIAKHNNNPIDEKQARQEITAAGVTPLGAEKKPEPTTIPIQPAPVQKPAAAATDVGSMLEALPSNPALWKQLAGKQQELLQPEYRQALQATIAALRKATDAFKTTAISPEQSQAYHFVMQMLNKSNALHKGQP